MKSAQEYGTGGTEEDLQTTGHHSVFQKKDQGNGGDGPESQKKPPGQHRIFSPVAEEQKKEPAKKKYR